MAAVDRSPTVDSVPPSATWRRHVAPLLRNEELSLLLLLGAVVTFFVILEPTTRSSRTYFDLLREVSPNLIAAIGITLLLLAGQFDLSIGSMLAFTGVVTVEVFNHTGNMWLGILAGLATGPLIGAINGYLVTVQGMNSLMTTLGSLFALRGIVYVYTNKTPIVDQHGFRDFNSLYHGSVGPVPTPGIIALLLILLFYIVITRTEFGRNIYAIGGNETAAQVSGIHIQRMKFTLFLVSSTMAAIAGLLIAAQTSTGYFDAGAQGFELIVIASAVLGGVSLAGGQGRLVSAMLGVMILGMTGKGMRLMNFHTTQQLVVMGIVMLIAVYLHRVRSQAAARSREWT